VCGCRVANGLAEVKLCHTFAQNLYNLLLHAERKFEQLSLYVFVNISRSLFALAPENTKTKKKIAF
jgi:hypothetical protein